LPKFVFLAAIFRLIYRTYSGTSVVDPDADPAFYLNADLDPDPESKTNENP
jgi:hypothetical protein